MSNPTPAGRFLLVVFVLLASILLVAYSNSFKASWHFDDYPNILYNSELHLSSLDLSQLNRALRANPVDPESDRLYRPLPCLTFALNWHFGKDDVFGYHAVNVAIHVLTTWILFLTMHLVLRIHCKNAQSSQFFLTASLLGALSWALAPIQTQSVTYIVQRMASMAALFTIIAIYAYLRGKTASSKRARVLWLMACLLSFFAALGSKENAILLPASLLLLEAAFFRQQITKRKIFVLALASGLVLAAGFVFVRQGLGIAPFSLSNPLSFLDSYANRSFTFSERILTQPRIVLTYLSQIMLPVAARLSVEHDVELSTSMLFPATTLPAILGILLLLSMAILFLKKHPLVCFPLLFFFLNHAVESTILQLELFFEHRNYLPSFFLFLPFGVLAAKVMHGSAGHSAFARKAAMFCSVFFLTASGHATYARNLDWANEGTLWRDAIRKAPNSSRAAHSLGCWHRQFGEYRAAHRYFQLSLRNADGSPDPKLTKKLSLNGLASVSYLIGNYGQSLQNFSECLELDDKDEACLKNRILAFLQLNRPQEALKDAEKLTHEHPSVAEYQYLAAKAAYDAGSVQASLDRLQKIAGRMLDDHQTMHLAGQLLAKSGAYANSLFFLRRATRLSPKHLGYQLDLAWAHYVGGQPSRAKDALRELVEKHPLPSMAKTIDALEGKLLDKEAARFMRSSIDAIMKESFVRHEEAR